jgi:hypothetical protein
METIFSRMSTKVCLSAISIFSVILGGNCQTFEQKKDVILKDKIPYVKLTGKAGALNDANLLVSSLKGDSLFTIKTWNYPHSNPKFQNLRGFKIDFSASKGSLIKLINTEYPPTNKEKIFQFLFKDFNKDLVVNDVMSADAETEFIKSFNGDLNIKQAFEYEKGMADYLMNYFPIDRNTDAPVSFEKVIETKYRDGSILRTMEVYQGKVYLATLTIHLTSEAVYTLTRKMEKPFVYNDEQISEVIVASAKVDAYFFQYKSLSTPTATLFSSISVKDEVVKMPIPNKGERELIDFLIANKLL